MRTARIVRLGALGVMLGALPAATTSAQEPVTGVQTVQLARPAFEPFYTRIRFDSDRGRMNAEGVGTRLWTCGRSRPRSPDASSRSRRRATCPTCATSSRSTKARGTTRRSARG